MKIAITLIALALLQFSCDPQEDDCKCYLNTYEASVQFTLRADGTSIREHIFILDTVEEIECFDADVIELDFNQELDCN